MNTCTETLTHSDISQNHALARDFAQRHIPVFPCREKDMGKMQAKSPYTRNGFKDATTDLATIDSWWKNYPDAVVGIPTGETAGLAVVDGDIDKDTGEPIGEAQISDLSLSHPDAVKVRTQSGGVQMIYKNVPGTSSNAKQAASHIDIRGDGGYIIAPGSIMANGAAYTYEGRTLPEALKAGDLPDFPMAAFKAAVAVEKQRKAQLSQKADQPAPPIALDAPSGLAEIAELLDHIDPDAGGYDQWCSVLMALHNHTNGGMDGLALADEWSQRGAKYEPGEVTAKWKSFKIGGGVGVGTIANLARAGGADLSAVSRKHKIDLFNPDGLEDDFGPPTPTAPARAKSESSKFSEPEPLPLLREIAPGEPYPVHALGPLRSAVECVQGITQAPLAIPAQSALAVASLAVQGFSDVETLAGPRPTAIYALTVAGSGERKSTCDSMMLAALRDHERLAVAEHQDAFSSWKNSHALWKGARDKILSEAKAGKGDKRTAAQADLEALGTEPTAPRSPDRTVTEPTLEGLTRLFVEGQPSLGLFSDEGGQFLGGHGMSADHRQKTLAALNGLWDGSPIRRTRAGDGAYTLHARRLAVHLMAQPGVARGLLADHMAQDTGFLARFLITEPPSTIGRRLHATATEDRGAFDAFSRRLGSILDQPLPVDEKTGGLDLRVLKLSPDARALLIEYADEIERQQAHGGQLAGLTGTASKSAEQAARLAGVLTLWETDLRAPEVPLEIMTHGIDLAQYYLAEALRLADAARVSAETEKAEELRKWLLTTWPEIARRNERNSKYVTPRDVVQWGPNALRETVKAKASLEMIAEYGWLVQLKHGAVIDGVARRLAYRIVRP